MSVNKITQLLCQNRAFAIGVALIAAVLPFLGWLSAATVALITLRKGKEEGALVFLVSLLPALAMLAFVPQKTFFAAAWICTQCAIFVAALGLRASVSWQNVLLAMTGIGLGAVAMTYLVVGDVIAFWQYHLAHFVQSVEAFFQANAGAAPSEQVTLMIDNLKQPGMLNLFAGLVTGGLVFIVLLSTLGHLALARWMQSKAFMPGGFDQEMRSLKVPKWVAMIFLGMTLGSILNVPIFVDMWLVSMVPFIVVGMCVLHSWMQQREWSTFKQTAMYILIALGVPYSLIGLGLFGLSDSWLDFRSRYLVSNS